MGIDLDRSNKKYRTQVLDFIQDVKPDEIHNHIYICFELKDEEIFELTQREESLFEFIKVEENYKNVKHIPLWEHFFTEGYSHVLKNVYSPVAEVSI